MKVLRTLLVTAVVLSAATTATPAADIDLRADPSAGAGREIVIAATVGAPGHAFVIFGPGDAWGFYPNVRKPATLLVDVPGELRQETAATVAMAGPEHRLSIHVDDATYAQLVAIRSEWKERDVYNLRDHDCITFAQAIAQALGLDLPDRTIHLPAPYLEALIARNRANRADLQAAAREREPLSQERLSALIAALKRERSRLLEELSHISAIPPGPGRPERIARLRELDRQIAELRRQRLRAPATQGAGGPTADPDQASGGGNGGGGGGGWSTQDPDDDEEFFGKFNPFDRGVLDQLAKGITEEAMAMVKKELEARLSRLSTKLAEETKILQQAKDALFKVMDEANPRPGQLEGLRELFRRKSHEVMQLEDAVLSADGRVKIFRQAARGVQAGMSGLLATVSLKRAEDRGRQLVKEGRYKEAWETYIGGATRFVTDVVMVPLNKVPGVRGAGIDILVGEAAEAFGRKLGSLTFDPINRTIQRWQRSSWWPRGLVAHDRSSASAAR